jgi:hypothetical protein
MVAFNEDFVDARKAFSSDIDTAVIELKNKLHVEFPCIPFLYRRFKAYYHPHPEDLSAIIEIKANKDSLCADCRKQFETILKSHGLKIFGRVMVANVTTTQKEDLIFYNLNLAVTVDDFQGASS